MHTEAGLHGLKSWTAGASEIREAKWKMRLYPFEKNKDFHSLLFQCGAQSNNF